MAAALRISFSKIFSSKSVGGVLTAFPVQCDISIRKISSRTTRGKGPVRPRPWPYEEKPYTIFNYFFDKTTPRFDENSKIIVVEGPVAAGKSKFARDLAKELEMLYLPEANLDMLYTNAYGYDLKRLDDQLPESCRSFDIKDFLKNPRHKKAASFQIRQYSVKYSQYIDALAHVLSTGEGVVLDRCVYSDFVFLEAMFSEKLISKKARSAYYEVRNNSLGELLRPHLVIYLDVPVEKTLANIKKRDITVETNSSALTPHYLSVMEKCYKQQYLKDISTHAELLVYDWSEGGDPEVVVEDIERIDFNRFDEQDLKLKDWIYRLEEQWGVLRHKYADQKDMLLTYLNVPCYDVPEFIIEAEDAKAFSDIWYNAPGMKYAEGFDSAMGDTGVLTKMSGKHRDTLPRRERRFP